MLRGSTATATTKTDRKFAWRTDASSIAGRWRLLQSQCSVYQLPRTLLLTSTALSSASLCHTSIRHAAYSTNRDDRLYSIATAASTKCEHDVTATRYARSTVATPSATASSSATTSHGSDDASSTECFSTVSTVNVQLQIC